MSVLESRTNNPNEFNPLNRISKLIISELRANSSLNYINRTSKPTRLTLLKPKDNIIDIIYNILIYHSDIINEVIPSSFNEMIIYQLCL